METVGAFEAKTHLSELLNRVSKGETITITRHGVPGGDAGSCWRNGEEADAQGHRRGMRALRKRIKPDTMSVREMVEEGRRF